jgi:hypothetical protein
MASSHDMTTVAEGGLTTAERRRPGRIEEISPALLPLLREPNSINLPITPAQDNDLDSARGILFGLLMSAALWICIALVYYLI